jgi:streptogramin lyase
MGYFFYLNRTLAVAAIVWISFGSHLLGQVGVVQEYALRAHNACPVAVALGPDGALWTTDCSTAKIARITTSGLVTEYSLPTVVVRPAHIVVGPDGALWFTETNDLAPPTASKIGRITTAGIITEYALPDVRSGPNGITIGPDGALWFTEEASNNIGRITTTGDISEFPIPTGLSQPAGITIGPDGALWFTEWAGNKIGRITTSGNIAEYSIPTTQALPSAITAGPDGSVWFLESAADKIGRITPVGVITEYALPSSASGAATIVAGPGGALWFTEVDGNRIGRITTAGVITEYAIPTPKAGPSGIVPGPYNALWFTEPRVGKIGRLVPDPPNTIQVATNLTAAGFTLFGPTQYAGAGKLWTQADAPAGKYTIVYEAVSSYNTPAPETKILSVGGTLTFSAGYDPVSPLKVQVTTNLGAASFSITPANGPGEFYNGGGKLWTAVAPAGCYRVTYALVPGYATPAARNTNCSDRGTLEFSGFYAPLPRGSAAPQQTRLSPAASIPPSVHIDSPASGSNVSGTITVAGWALDNAIVVGTAIGGVQVLVDGVAVGTAIYGVSRPDVCGVYPGRPGCPNVGFNFQLNTSTLTAGQHTITISATDTDAAPDTGTASVTVMATGIPPTVHIDAPSPGSVLSGTVSVSGWALDNAMAIGTAINSVQVMVDGAVVGSATYGVSRPDVCAVYPGRLGCPNVGYSYSLNTSTLTPGSHTITVSATDTDGTPDVGAATVTITVANGPPTVYIDSPTPGTVVSGTVTVSGWALDNTTTIGTPISSVRIQVDGTVVGTATYGTSRPDVCTAYSGRPGCPNVGFTFSLNTATLTSGSHLLTATATDSDTSPDSGSWSVTIQVGAPPSVSIDTPAGGSTISGTVTVAGWAIDNTAAVGTAISSVQVKVDGTVVGTATYGISRPDVCAVYPGRPGCPNVGYSYSLNTATLTAGTHTITVAATDSDGTPDIGSATIMVTVSGPPPSVHIDSPATSATVSGVVIVAGWAIDNATAVGTAISSVQVKVDGTVVGTATYGISRPDVCAAYPGRPGCPNVGYSYSLNTATLTGGTHTIAVVATDSDGTPDTGSASTTVSVSAAAPSVNIDSPAASATVSGVVTVAGWAIDNTTAVGTAISSVQVKVDGTAVGTATYGISRPDVCAAYPGRPGCPNVGFTFQLNTASLSAGSHTVTVVATDSDGTPDSGSASIPVTVFSNATITVSSDTIGANLEDQITITFNPALPADTTLTISSGNPAAVLIGNSGTQGKGQLQTTIGAGTSTVTTSAQALTNSGTVTITASAPGYTSGTGTITLANSGFVISGPNGIGASFTTYEGVTTGLTISAALLDSNGLFVANQSVAGGQSFNLSIAAAPANLGTLATNPVAFSGGTSGVTVNFVANSSVAQTGSVSLTQPTGFTNPVIGGSVSALVQTSGLIAPTLTVGKNLEAPASVTLTGPAPTAVTVTLTSSDTSKLVFSSGPSDATVNNPFNITIPAGQTSTPTFYVRGYASSGSVPYTVSSSNYGTVNASMPLGPSGLAISLGSIGSLGSPFSINVSGSDATLYVWTVLLDNTGAPVSIQAVAADQSISATVSSGNTSVGTITTSPVVIGGGSENGTTTFHPLTTGTSTVTASATGYGSGTIQATVTSCTVTINNGLTVGQFLEAQGVVNLSCAAGTGGVPVLLSSNSANLKLAVNPTDPGSNSITVTVGSGFTTAAYYVYALAGSGSGTYSVSAPSYTSGPNDTVTFAPSGVVILESNGANPPSAVCYGTCNVPLAGGRVSLTVFSYQLSTDGLNTPVGPQPVMGTGSANVSLGNSNTAAGTLSSGAPTIAAGSYYATVSFTPKATQSTTVSVTQPTGMTTPGPFNNANVAQIAITIN